MENKNAKRLRTYDIKSDFSFSRGQSSGEPTRQDSSKIEVHLKSSLKTNLFGCLSNPSLRPSFPCNACIKRYLSRVSFHLHQSYLLAQRTIARSLARARVSL